MPRPSRPQELNHWGRPYRSSPGIGHPPPPGWEHYALDLLEYIADALERLIDLLQQSVKTSPQK